MSTTHFWVRLTSILTCFVALAGCSSVQYVSADDVRQAYRSDTRVAEDGGKKLRQFGAIRFTKQTPDDSDDRVFLLKRDSGKYMAETVMFDSAKSKDTFQRGYFAFGADQKGKSVGMHFRFEF